MSSNTLINEQLIIQSKVNNKMAADKSNLPRAAKTINFFIYIILQNKVKKANIEEC